MTESVEMEISYDGGKTWHPSGFLIRPESVREIELSWDVVELPEPPKQENGA